MSLMSFLLTQAIRILRPLPGTRKDLPSQRRELERLSLLVRVPRGVRVRITRPPEPRGWWLTPPGAGRRGAIYYLHGGAYMIGSPYTHREMTGLLALYSRLPLFSLDYRLAPEHPFPAALEDAVSGYQALLEMGFPPQSIVLAGDSAGGGLCVSLMIALRDMGRPLPGGAALISPWTDLAGEGESMLTRRVQDPLFQPGDLPRTALNYLNGHDPRDPWISPVYANPRGLPPVLIQVGDHELLLSDSTRLHANFTRAGVQSKISIWPGMWHVFQAIGERMPESRRALREMAAFLAGRVYREAASQAPSSS